MLKKEMVFNFEGKEVGAGSGWEVGVGVIYKLNV